VNTAHTWTHNTVLLNEAIAALLAQPLGAADESDGGAGQVADDRRVQGTYVDGTFGRGGHTRALLSRLSPAARVVVFDKDPEAIAAAQLLGDARVLICHASFADMASELAALGIEQVQGILLDLGVSSPQIDNPARGFSFRFDAPLDMRMDTTRGQTAAEFLAHADVQEITEVIRDYGEERFALQIAKALVARRESGSAVTSTAELSALVARAVRTREPGQDPATRTFQALRIHVNAELEALKQGLKAALTLLVPGGRLVVISFHSLEDRIVKTFIAKESRDEVDRRAPFAPARAMRLNAVARIKPSYGEVLANPRARSAVLRVAERTAVA
jgi:16S rRNA (cytosine1402-N4)-methyltransferase